MLLRVPGTGRTSGALTLNSIAQTRGAEDPKFSSLDPIAIPFLGKKARPSRGHNAAFILPHTLIQRSAALVQFSPLPSVFFLFPPRLRMPQRPHTAGVRPGWRVPGSCFPKAREHILTTQSSEAEKKVLRLGEQRPRRTVSTARSPHTSIWPFPSNGK